MPVDTTTPNLSLTLPFQGELNWDSKVNGNFSILDQSAAKINGSYGNISISAGPGIDVGGAAQTLTISASIQTSAVSVSGIGNTIVSSTGVYSNTLSISGAGIISVGIGLGSITISATTPSVTNYSSISLSASGNTTNSSTGSLDNQLVVSAAGIASVGVGAGSITISVPAPQSTQQTDSIFAIGNTTVSSSGTIGQNLSVSGVGIVSVGMENGTLTISATTPSIPTVTNFSLNGSSSSVSLVAGPGIALQSNLSTITISNSLQASTITASILGNNLGGLSTSATIANGIDISAGGIISIGASGNTISISATTPAVVNFSTQTVTLAGNTLGAASTTATIANGVSISGAGIVSVGGSGGTITISATAGAGGGSVNLTALGNTTSSSAGSFSSLLDISGAGIVSVGVGNGSITISATTPSVTNFSTVSLSASGNTTVSSTGTFNNALVFSAAGIASVGVGAGTVTISVPAAGAAPVTVSAVGNTTGLTTTLQYNNTLSISGAGIVSVGMSSTSLVISATTPSVQSVVVMSGNTSGTSSSIATGTLFLQAVSPIGLSQSTTTGTGSTTSNILSIFGPAYSAGANVQVSTTGGTVSYAATGVALSSNVINAFQISGNSSGTSSLIQTGTLYLQAISPLLLSQSTTTGTGSTTSNVVSIQGPAYSAGAGLAVSTTGGTISYSASVQTSSVSMSALGNSTVSSTGTFSNALNISGVGIVSVGVGAGSITISATTPSVVSSVNGSTGALSISAGAGIGIGNAASTVTISASVQTSTVSLSGVGNTTLSSSGTYSNVLSISGAGIVSVGISNNNVTISATSQASAAVQSVVVMSGNTSGTSSSISTGTLYLQAVSPMVLSQSTTTGTSSTTSNILSIIAPAFSAGANLAVSTTGGTISYSASVQTSNVSMSAVGNSTVSSTGAYSNTLSISGAGIISVGVGAGSITISATTPSVTNFSTITASMAGNTLGAASTTLTVANSLSISGAGIVSVGASAGTLTISATTQASANVVSAVVMSGNTAGTSSSITGTLYLQAISPLLLSQSTTTGTGSTTSNVLSIQGPAYSAGGNLLLSTTGGTVSYSINVTNFSTITATALGENTLGAASTTATIGNGINFSGAGVVSVGMSGNTITISAPSVAAGAVSMSASGNSTISSTGTFSTGLVFSGAGNVSVGVGAGTVTISASGGAGFTLNGTTNSVSIVAGSGISISSNASTITIGEVPGRISFTEVFPFQEASPVSIATLTASGSTYASATNNPFGSSFSLQRIMIPAVMSLTEVDLAFGINFPASNSGQGSISQSFIIYSFGNSTSLASVLSASRAVSWASGTTTSGTASSLQQGWGDIAGGNSQFNVQPFTFAASSLAPGEYVIGHLMSWALSTTNWTLSVFGGPQAVSSLTGMSVALQSGSIFTASVSTAITAHTVAPTQGVAISLSRTSAFARVQTSTSSTQTVALTAFSAAPLGVSVISNAGTGAINVLSSSGLSSGSFFTASTAGTIASLTSYNFAYNGTFAMSTASTQNTYQWGQFQQGIMSTGSVPVAVTLSTSAVIASGSLALIQPWFALLGS